MSSPCNLSLDFCALTSSAKFRFGNLLDIEQEQEHSAARDRIESRTINDLVRDGYAMADLGGRWSDKLQFGKPCAIFHKVGSSATKDFGWSRLM